MDGWVDGRMDRWKKNVDLYIIYVYMHMCIHTYVHR